MNYLIDTNAVLYELKGIGVPLELQKSDAIYISFITKIELLSFPEIKENEIMAIKIAVANLNVIYIDDVIIEKSVSIRQKYSVKLPDAIISATALSIDAVLVTADKQLLKAAEQMGIETKNPL